MITASETLNTKFLIVGDQESNVLLLEQLLHDAGHARVTSTSEITGFCAQIRRRRAPRA
jgi:PleD family two-component response regulator